MATVTASVTAKMSYETEEHETCEQGTNRDGTRVAVQMTWADLQDPDLVEDFKNALEKLERLCYALYGARPKSFSPYTHWKYRRHPRCLWQVEQKRQMDDCPTCDGAGYSFSEYGAEGETTTSGSQVRPSLPYKSRSGDPKLQRLDGQRVHNDDYFPVGSVERSGDQVDGLGRSTFDPEAHAHFGATPDDPDDVGNPSDTYWDVDHDIHYAGEAVTVSYTPPEDKTVLAAEVQYYDGVVDDGLNLSESDGVWSVDLPIWNQGTTIQWYLKVTFDNGDDPDIVKYEPGGDSAPSWANSYSFKQFTHWNPYASGFPELWSLCAKGTDRYEFDETETIQVGLINLARFICAYIGAHCYHDPTQQGSMAACCFRIPIEFRWSGSASWPQYCGTGKGGTSGYEPLHNVSAIPSGALEKERKSWYGQEVYSSNPNYGHGASWLPIPEVLTTMDFDSNCNVFFTGHQRGLMPWHIINEVHLQEIIAAVDYLLSGIWVDCDIKYRKKTMTAHGTCGTWSGTAKNSRCLDHPGEFTTNTWDSTEAAGWYESDYWCCAGYDWDGDPGEQCVIWETPADWDACINDTYHNLLETDLGELVFGKCYLCKQFLKFRRWGSGANDTPPTRARFCVDEENIICGDSAYFTSQNMSECLGCGTARCGYCEGDYYGSGDVCTGETRGWDDEACAWSYELYNVLWEAWMCTPDKCPGGCDSVHGNGLGIKSRSGYNCDGSIISTGFSAGNCYEYAYTCEDTGGDHYVSFNAVETIFVDSGMSESWDCDIPDCEDMDCPHPTGIDTDWFPSFPGFPDFTYFAAVSDPEAPICQFCETTDPEDPQGCTCPAYYDTGYITESYESYIKDEELYSQVGACTCQIVCPTDRIYCSIDLKLDEGYPTLTSYEEDPGEDYEDICGNYWWDCPCSTTSSKWGSTGQGTDGGSCIAQTGCPE